MCAQQHYCSHCHSPQCRLVQINMSDYLSLIPIVAAVIAVVDILRRKSLAQSKPWLTCVLDTLFYIPHVMEIGPWGEPNDINTAIVKAIKATGLKDVGSTECAFMARYSTARTAGYRNAKATYSPTGYLIALNSLQKRMEMRLKFVDYLKKHPKVLDVKMEDPVFVIGFPRTGTTFLHELLGLYPQFRSHYSWEQMDTVPRTDDESIEALEADRKKRYEGNRGHFDLMLRLAGPSIQSVHRIGYDETEECTTPCALELPWAVPELPFVAYACQEVIPMGAGETFDLYKKQLQLMTFQSADRRDKDFTWMLKCPFHLPYLSELHHTFPQGTVVWTHRDPCECIASCCSLYEHLMWLCFENHTIDRNALGRYVMLYTKLALEKAFESLEKDAASFKVVHIRYADTIKDPKGMCKSILDKVGREYTAEYDRILDEYLAKNAAKREAMKKEKTGNRTSGENLHAYSLEEYGLSREQVEEAFKGYIEKYNLKETKNKK